MEKYDPKKIEKKWPYSAFARKLNSPIKHQIALHTRHDSNVTLFKEDRVEKYLELEKITGERYFSFSTDKEIFKRQFKKWVVPYVDPAEISDVVYSWVTEDQLCVLKDIFVNTVKWKQVSHHISHVWSAYMFTDPKEGDLIVSIDGGGDLDDYFKIYLLKGQEAIELEDIKINLGKAYRILGLLSPELYQDQVKGYKMDRALSG